MGAFLSLPSPTTITNSKVTNIEDALPSRRVDVNNLIKGLNGIFPTLKSIVTDTITDSSGNVIFVNGLFSGTSIGNVADSGQEITVLTTLVAATIAGTAAGTLGNANGVVLVAAPTSAYALQFIRAIAIYDFNTAAYTGGGNDTSIRLGSGGAAITGIVTSANLLGAVGDKIVRFDPLTTAALPVSVGVAISINSTTAWTQPGTAAGVVRIYTTYRVITTNL